MDFFKSVFSDEPESPTPGPDPTSTDDPYSPPRDPNPKTTDDGDSGGWSFGGLIRTLTTKSESVIDTYRRDLKEFGSGLRKEIEVAHGSLENVGHAIDELGTSVLKGTAQIISHGKEAILSLDQESDSSDNNNADRSIGQLHSKRYSRFDAQLHAIQGDVSTYCEELEDLEEYKKWKLGFVLEKKREESKSLIEENGAMESVYKRVVPNSVNEETFWCRYYYRVYKLKQAEDLRANLVKRAISEEEEDLSWDVDDDEEEEKEDIEDEKPLVEIEGSSRENASKDWKFEETNQTKAMNDRESEPSVKSSEMVSGESETSGGDNVVSEQVELEKSKEESALKSDEKAGLEVKGDNGESCKDSEFSVVSSHQSMAEEEDLGWDEIEDLSSMDEKRTTGQSGSPSKIDLQKRLSVAEEDEDLSWDIEDDDEPAKA
ncbi:hypothetical protein K2173_004687 [Erythroxylum novogranatense]|uniref:BSD domain-containing protein n=1 Tax=Erythroxylum novogranatense TaxID=1862640 RepID=A0AAV8U8A4_9ROSI|nr:hypothetical protein K2173_004687 [Erythroxylum novogranatense]